MSRRGIACVAVLSLAIFAAPAARGESLDDVKKAIASKYKDYKTLQYKSRTTSNMEYGEGMSMKSETDMTLHYQRKDEKTIQSRMEMKSKSVQKTGDNEVKMDTTMLVVSDGQFVWTLSDYAGTKTATKAKVDPVQQDVFDQDKFFKQQEEMYSLKLLPDATVDGKPCYVIEMTPKQEMIKQSISKMLQYYDKKTGVALKSITYDAKGKESGTMVVTDLKVDESIPADKFQFKAPAGVEVVDQTKS